MDFDEAKQAIQAVIDAGHGVADGMGPLFDYCKATRPSPGWDLLRKRDFRAELSDLAGWLGASMSIDPPPPTVTGLHLEVTDAGDHRPTLRLTGTVRIASEPADWTATPDFPSPLLTDVAQFLARGGPAISELGVYVLLGGYLALAAHELLVAPDAPIPKETALGGAAARTVLVGFEGGDRFLVGTLDGDGGGAASAGSPDDDSDGAGSESAIDEEAALLAMDDIVFGGLTVPAGMAKLLAYCKAQHPSPGWDRLAATNFEQELPALRAFVEGALQDDPPPDEVDGLHLGIYFPEPDGGGEPLPVVYLAGTDKYTDEAWGEATAWAARDFESSTVRELWTFTRKGGEPIASYGETVLCLGWLCLAARAVFGAIDRELILGDNLARAVAVGFEGSSYFSLGVLDDEGSQLGTP